MAKSKKLGLNSPDELRSYLSGQSGVLVDTVIDYDVLSTGVWTLDRALGAGGLPYGSIVEFFGKWQTAKSTVAIMTAAQALQYGGVLFLDFEASYNRDYFIALGVDVDSDRFVLAQPDTLEEGIQLAELAVGTGQVRLVVIDSLASAVTQAEVDDDVTKSHVAVKAKLVALFLRKIRPLLTANNVILLVVNHEMEKIGGFGFGAKQTTTPGGTALKYFAAIRVNFKVRASLKRTESTIYGDKYEKPVASVIQFVVVKNKFAPPHRRDTFYVFFGSGASNVATLLDIAVVDGIVQKAGSIFKFKNPYFSTEVNKRGLLSTLEYIENNEAVRFEFLAAVFAEHPDLAPKNFNKETE